LRRLPPRAQGIDSGAMHQLISQTPPPRRLSCHAEFCERRRGYRQIAGMRSCPRINAPAVVPHIELSEMHEQISGRGGSRDSQQRSRHLQFIFTQRPPLSLFASPEVCPDLADDPRRATRTRELRIGGTEQRPQMNIGQALAS